MHEKPDVSDAALLLHLRAGYDVGAETVEFPPLGADADSFSHRVRCTEQTLFLKLRRGAGADAAARVALAARLAADERACVLAPIPARDGRPFTTISGFTAVLAPFVEGCDGFEAPMTERQWLRFGTVC